MLLILKFKRGKFKKFICHTALHEDEVYTYRVDKGDSLMMFYIISYLLIPFTMFNVLIDPLFFHRRSLPLLLKLVTVRFPYILSNIFIKSGKTSTLQIVHPLLSLKKDQLNPTVAVISYV